MPQERAESEDAASCVLALASLLVYDLRHGLWGKTRRKSLVRWMGVNPGPG